MRFSVLRVAILLMMIIIMLQSQQMLSAHTDTRRAQPATDQNYAQTATALVIIATQNASTLQSATYRPISAEARLTATQLAEQATLQSQYFTQNPPPPPPSVLNQTLVIFAIVIGTLLIVAIIYLVISNRTKIGD